MFDLKQNQRCELTSQSLEMLYTQQDQETWRYLYAQQLVNLKDKASPVFLKCLAKLKLPRDHIPSLKEVSNVLKPQTGWEIVRVDGLISNEEFFTMLANKQFPSNTYIRSEKEITLSKDPDIFHELFGHVPILIHPIHNEYIKRFGELGLEFDQIERNLLQRLYWFTYEVGLIKMKDGIRIIGGSVLSSIAETQAVFNSLIPKKPFSLIEVLRTPYRADKPQDVYFILNKFSALFTVLNNKKKLQKIIWKAYKMGEYPASFPLEGTKYESTGCCFIKEKAIA